MSSSASRKAPQKSSPAPILRRTRGDLVATAVISAIAVFGVGTVWATSDTHHAQLDNTNVGEVPQQFAAPVGIADHLHPLWKMETAALPGVVAPVTLRDQTLIVDNAEDGSSTIRAIDASGKERWNYQRSREVCSLAKAWDNFVVTYRGPNGCGDVLSFSPEGRYTYSRSAIAPEIVAPLSSNDRVGIGGPGRVEIWRSDLVRTVEYGRVEAPQEASMQPAPTCIPNSALTRKELLAITETCADGAVWLRLTKATPEDSRKPELIGQVELKKANDQPAPHGQEPAARRSDDPYLVAINAEGVSVMFPKGRHAKSPQPLTISYNNKGQELSHKLVKDEVPAPPEIRTEVAHRGAFKGHGDQHLPFGQASFVHPVTADLAHHMTWWDGHVLHFFKPGKLEADYVLDNVIGTGVSLSPDEKKPGVYPMILPTAEGLAVLNENDGKVIKTIAVDREGWTGDVHLSWANGRLVEQRGTTIVGLGVKAQ